MSDVSIKGRDVFVVRGESNLGNESWVVGVFETQEAAEAEVERLRDLERSEGGVPYGDPIDGDEDNEEDPDWTTDWEISEETIR